jgi:hypothetical protein
VKEKTNNERSFETDMCVFYKGPIYEPKDSNFRPWNLSTLLGFLFGRFLGRMFRRKTRRKP